MEFEDHIVIKVKLKLNGIRLSWSLIWRGEDSYVKRGEEKKKRKKKKRKKKKKEKRIKGMD